MGRVPRERRETGEDTDREEREREDTDREEHRTSRIGKMKDQKLL